MGVVVREVRDAVLPASRAIASRVSLVGIRVVTKVARKVLSEVQDFAVD